MGLELLNISQLQSSRNLTKDLVISLRKQILEGNLQPGTKLPPAKEIEQKAGVSRSVVREAIAALKAEGLISSRQGVGMFVADSANQKPFSIDEKEFASVEDAVHIVELRMSVELEMAALAAKNRTEEQMQAIWQALDAFSSEVKAGGDAIEQDLAFHLAIADASGNPYFGRFIRYIGQGAIPRRTLISEHDNVTREQYLAIIHEEHSAIARAIEEKEPQLAREATRAHLANSRNKHLTVARMLREGKA
ncbi:FadR family transcriptional regulator [Bowmanella sp. Y26]|uniref:FadR/GntR family transcriptional regulator n=1 Tax=Bowmanella yangjiangensis TaxID=2811230 RepID=UPI001BDD358F|nr:FadR/GntR family transcriptional regulator [Bowmanella yangjiangensis]MBT1063383.1 FadR family transcriptional regulator [Bowmanella yangjiangensis]